MLINLRFRSICVNIRPCGEHCISEMSEPLDSCPRSLYATFAAVQLTLKAEKLKDGFCSGDLARQN